MALPITTQLQIGEHAISEFTNLTISQPLFGHHQFSVAIPYDRVEGSKGTFLSKAHQQFCGQRLTVALTLTNAPAGAAPAAAFKFQGIVTQLQVGNQGDSTGFFLVQGYSPTYLLDQAPARRTFRQQTLLAIFQQVLQPYSDGLLPLQAKPQHTAPLPYVAQYDESDFAFLHRLAAQYGEWFYYDGTRLQLGKPTGAEIPFVSDGVRASLSLTIALRHSAFVVSQYSLPEHKTLRATSQGQAVGWLGQNQFADFALGQSERLFTKPMQLPATVAVATQAEVNEVAARYKSQHATSLVSGNGWGENPALQLGSILSASGEGLGTEAEGEESFGKYLLTQVVHTVDGSDMYTNLFEAVPWSVEHPPLGPYRKAPAGQDELAEVIDHQDPQRLGRVRVRYYWPVAKPTEAETDWLRVSTPYSGAGKGQLFTPEIGSQVLVGYESNRAEQPLVLGNLFHPRNPQQAHYTNPQNNLKGMQTAGGNKFVMSDAQGDQTIHISNSNNKDTAIEVGFKGDGSITIKSKGAVTILSATSITLDASAKGEMKLHAKNITMEAEEEIKVSSKTKNVALAAKLNISADAEQNVALEGKADFKGKGRNAYLEGTTDAHVKSPKNRLN